MNTPSQPISSGQDELRKEVDKLHDEFLTAYLKVYDDMPRASLSRNYISENKLSDIVTQFMNQLMEIVSHHTQEAVKAAEAKAKYDEANNIAGNMRDNRECVTCYNNLSKLDGHIKVLKASLASTAPQNTSLTSEQKEGGDDL